MSPEQPSVGVDQAAEIPALIAIPYRTGKRLEELTGGKIDTVADASGNVLLLPEAQNSLASGKLTGAGGEFRNRIPGLPGPACIRSKSLTCCGSRSVRRMSHA